MTDIRPHEETPPADEPVRFTEASLQLLYEENGRVVATFWEWRHKVILLCAAMIGLVLSICSWLYKEKLGGVAIGVPFLFASAGAYMCRRFDRRNGEIIADCVTVGNILESRLASASEGVVVGGQMPLTYSSMKTTREAPNPYCPPSKTYSSTLYRAYFWLGVAFLIAAIAAFVIGAAHPSTLVPRGH